MLSTTSSWQQRCEMDRADRQSKLITWWPVVPLAAMIATVTWRFASQGESARNSPILSVGAHEGGDKGNEVQGWPAAPRQSAVDSSPLNARVADFVATLRGRSPDEMDTLLRDFAASLKAANLEMAFAQLNADVADELRHQLLRAQVLRWAEFDRQ